MSLLGGWAWCYACIALRFGPMIAALPTLSIAGSGWWLRALLISMFCCSITPLMVASVTIEIPENATTAGTLLLGELLFGCSIALATRLFFAGFQTAGNHLVSLSGIELGENQGEDGLSSVVERILFCLIGALFFVSGGHRLLIQLVFETLTTHPIGHLTQSAGTTSDLPTNTDWYRQIALLFGSALSIGVRLAAPAVAILICVQLGTAWLSRCLPAWNRNTLGTSTQMLGLLAGLLVIASGAGWFFQEEITTWMDESSRAISIPSRWSSASDATEVRDDG